MTITPGPSSRAAHRGRPDSPHSSTTMTVTGHASAASTAQSARSSGTSPSAGLSLTRYCSVTELRSSAGSCSKMSGQSVQQDSQLMHPGLSIVTFTTLDTSVSLPGRGSHALNVTARRPSRGGGRARYIARPAKQERICLCGRLPG